MRINRQGITRIVFLTKKYAIKIPNFTCQWNHFLQGLLSNINESTTWKYNSGQYEEGNSHLLCPVVWASWGGWILIMKRAVPCKFFDEGGEEIDYSKWIVAGFGGDDKPLNYGQLNGRIVKLDYGQ